MTEVPIEALIEEQAEQPKSEADQAVAELMEYIQFLEHKYGNRIKFDPKLLEIKLGLSFTEVPQESEQQ